MTYLSNKSGDGNDLGYFATSAALIAAYPVGIPGLFAIVGSTNTIWVWDEGTMSWVDTGNSGSGTPVYNEIVSGSGTSFTLANTPIVGSVTLYGGGGRLTLGTDYSISGIAITILVGSYSAGTIVADYIK